MRAKPKGWNPKGRADQARMIATRRAIQGGYIRLMVRAGFEFETNNQETKGSQKEVLEEVGNKKYGRTPL